MTPDDFDHVFNQLFDGDYSDEEAEESSYMMDFGGVRIEALCARMPLKDGQVREIHFEDDTNDGSSWSIASIVLVEMGGQHHFLENHCEDFNHIWVGLKPSLGEGFTVKSWYDYTNEAAE